MSFSSVYGLYNVLLYISYCVDWLAIGSMLITLVSHNVNNCFLFRKRCGVACKQDGVVLYVTLIATPGGRDCGVSSRYTFYVFVAVSKFFNVNTQLHLPCFCCSPPFPCSPG